MREFRDGADRVRTGETRLGELGVDLPAAAERLVVRRRLLSDQRTDGSAPSRWAGGHQRASGGGRRPAGWEPVLTSGRASDRRGR